MRIYTSKQPIKFRRIFYYAASILKLYSNIEVISFIPLTLQIITGKIKFARLKKYKLVFKLKTLLDLLTLKEVVLDEEYENKGVRIGNKDKVIVDIGAGFGDFSILAAKRFPKAKIYAFEPDSVYFRFLGENISSNKIKNIFPFDKAIYDLKSLFQSIQSKTIDFLKMDCEGCEFAILARNPYLGDIRKIVMEYHEDNKRKVDILKQTLEKANFKVKLFPRKEVENIGLLTAYLNT